MVKVGAVVVDVGITRCLTALRDRLFHQRRRGFPSHVAPKCRLHIPGTGRRLINDPFAALLQNTYEAYLHGRQAG